MLSLSFEEVVKKDEDGNYDDEEATLALIQRLVNETAPRVVIEDFPRNEKQARLFIRNCIAPTAVFYVKCSKDIC
jgi:hypothetical protein